MAPKGGRLSDPNIHWEPPPKKDLMSNGASDPSMFSVQVPGSLHGGAGHVAPWGVWQYAGRGEGVITTPLLTPNLTRPEFTSMTTLSSRFLEKVDLAFAPGLKTFTPSPSLMEPWRATKVQHKARPGAFVASVERARA